MSRYLMLKLSVDRAMTILMVLAMASLFTGNLWHVIIGSALCLLFFLHNFLYRRWYTVILKGRYDLYRALDTTTNLFWRRFWQPPRSSAFCLRGIFFTSVPYGDELLVRRVHTAAAHWGHILIGMHLGLHWTLIMGGFRKMAKTTGPNWLRTVVLRVIAAGIMICGIRASFQRNIGVQLISCFTFSFRDPAHSAAGYLLNFICIMGLYAVIARYNLKLIRHRDKA